MDTHLRELAQRVPKHGHRCETAISNDFYDFREGRPLCFCRDRENVPSMVHQLPPAAISSFEVATPNRLLPLRISR